ncbi:MAG: Holliday junction branch migration protein RuvA [Bacteroidaceae bacterium]|nr:Holliday junction branch migration protein RuvA [Bacteroidaceae bacterium]
MIDYVRGELAEITPAYAVVDVNGVGYGLNISLNTYTAIQREKQVKLYVYEAIREDAFVLFGFAKQQERKMFELLISVSGVGANTARVILSEMSLNDLASVITSDDAKTLKNVKGIGLKTAQRIIIELKDKVLQAGIVDGIDAVGGAGSSAATAAVGINTEVKDEAVGALTMLGFQAAISNKVVIALLKETPDMPVEQVVKQALKLVK